MIITMKLIIKIFKKDSTRSKIINNYKMKKNN